MAKWGSCDYRQLQELEKRLEQLAEVDADALCRQAAQRIAQILLNKTKRRTPVATGALKDRWTATPVGHRADRYVTVVLNNLHYAPYVEYGHRTRDHKKWREGAFMLTMSEMEVRTLAPGLLEKMVYEALREVFT